MHAYNEAINQNISHNRKSNHHLPRKSSMNNIKTHETFLSGVFQLIIDLKQEINAKMTKQGLIYPDNNKIINPRPNP